MPRSPVPRELAILEEIVQYYLEHHEAISARTLAKVSRLALSPTTIRNLMEDLSAEGLLTSEGVPRGRVPTQKAFGIYVTRLNPEPATLPAPARHEVPTLDAALDAVGTALADVTGCVALAAFPEPDAYPLGWVHFGVVPDNRVLVAVHSLLDDLWSKVLETAQPFPDDLLRDVASFLNARYRGAPLKRIRQDIMAGQPKELLDRTPSAGAAFRMLRKAFEWDRQLPRTWGQENLLRMRIGQDAERLYQIQAALADPDLLVRGLDLGRSVGGAHVALGTETGYAGLEECAVIAHRFGAGAWQGTLAVLGPMGMNYTRALESLVPAARSLSDFVMARFTAAHLPGVESA